MDDLDDKRLADSKSLLRTPAYANQLALVRKTHESSNKVVLSEENQPVRLFKKPRVVLAEDDFTDRLQEIIVRDYFPELPKLKAQHEYLDAVERNDVEKMRILQLRYSSNFTNGPKTPAVRVHNKQGGKFDVDTDVEDVFANEEGKNDAQEPGTSGTSDLDKHTVQSFVDTFVSEDTKSFHDVCEVDARKLRNVHEWIYDAEKRHAKEFETRDDLRDRPAEIDNWKYKARNAVLFEPEEVAPTAAEYIERLSKDRKEINRQGTRIDVKDVNWKDPATKGTNQYAVPRVDITGKVIESGAQDTRGFDVLPTPEPTVAPDDTPFITWGQIDGTPFRLDGGDVPLAQDGAPTFKLPEPTKRELIAHEMVEKIKRNNQAKRAFSQQMTQKLRNANSRMSTLSRMAMLSPAAHKLASTKLGIKTRLTGQLTRRTPASVRLNPGSLRVTPRATPASASTKQEPMESIINEDLLSVRSSVRKL